MCSLVFLHLWVKTPVIILTELSGSRVPQKRGCSGGKASIFEATCTRLCIAVQSDCWRWLIFFPQYTQDFLSTNLRRVADKQQTISGWTFAHIYGIFLGGATQNKILWLLFIYYNWVIFPFVTLCSKKKRLSSCYRVHPLVASYTATSTPCWAQKP